MPKEYTREQLDAKKVKELLAIARDLHGPKTELVYMRKDDLIDYILTGSTPKDTRRELYSDSLARKIAEHVNEQNEDRFRELVREELSDYIPTLQREAEEFAFGDNNHAEEYGILSPERIRERAEVTQHPRFPELVQMIIKRQHALIVGPVGCGIEQAAINAAKANALPFAYVALSEETTDTHLFGMIDINVRAYRQSMFRKCYENGGVFLLSSVDRASDALSAEIAVALSTGYAVFPDGIVQQHDDFVCVASMFGAVQAVNDIEGRLLAQFSVVEWTYDEEHELEVTTNKKWTQYVQAVRRFVCENGFGHVVPTTASVRGAQLLEAGLDWETVADAVVWKGLDESTRQTIIDAVGEFA